MTKSTQIKISPVDKIKVDLGLDPDGDTQEYFKTACWKRMGKYVPGKEQSKLHRTADLKQPKKVIYQGPYAHYLYIGKLYVMDNGKGAYYNPSYGYWSDRGKKKHPTDRDLIFRSGGSHWAERMISVEKKELIKEMEEYIRRRS